ncbi:hypothetical protein C8R45DRAFT_1095588 [Mycena sanguinolenta]|nr:hypothetical protein C8R45DRAFT_1095588 [Mycena sanguinolenta]
MGQDSQKKTKKADPQVADPKDSQKWKRMENEKENEDIEQEPLRRTGRNKKSTYTRLERDSAQISQNPTTLKAVTLPAEEPVNDAAPITKKRRTKGGPGENAQVPEQPESPLRGAVLPVKNVGSRERDPRAGSPFPLPLQQPVTSFLELLN